MRGIVLWSSIAVVGCLGAFTACGDSTESPNAGGIGGDAAAGDGSGGSSISGGDASNGGSAGGITPGGTGGNAGRGGMAPEGGGPGAGGDAGSGGTDDPGSGGVGGASEGGAGGASEGGAGGAASEPEALLVPTCAAGGTSRLSGLVGFWHGENNFDDAFGLHPGTNAGAVSFSPTRLGSGFNFNGSENSFVSIPDSPSLAVTAGITMDAWIYATQLGGRIFDKITASGSDGYLLDTYGGKLRMKIGGETLTAAAELPVATWVHVAGTYDGQQMTLYVDGQPVGALATTTAIPSNTHALRIGADAAGGSRFSGAIDEAHIYDRGLSSTDMLILHAAASAKDGLVSWWHADGSEPFVDALGRNSGTAAKSSQTPGVLGLATQFDGTVGSFAQMPDSESLRFTSAITMEAWIKPKTLGGRIFDKITGGTADGYLLDTNASKLRLIVAAGVVTSTVTLALGVWTHVVATYDRTNIALYINGVPQGGAAYTALIPVNARPLQLAADSAGASRFDGAIDEARIYGRALTGAEISSLYSESQCTGPQVALKQN